VDEEPILEALFTAHEMLNPIFELQSELRHLAGKPKREFTPKAIDPALLEAARQRMAMNFGRAVVDPKWPNIAIDALDHRVARNADRSEYLQASIDDAPKRL